MKFKDFLENAFKEIGGITPDNLWSVAELAQEIVDDTTVAYIMRLLAGQPPRDIDRPAFEHAFGVETGEDRDDQARMRRDLTNFALEKNFTKWSAERFADTASLDSSFREQNLSNVDKEILLARYNNRSYLDIEAEIFGL